jgi:cardiolipin synthase (CMP-forming)
MSHVNFHFLKQLPAHEKRITISTVFTLVRIALTPCIVMAVVWGAWDIAFGLFVFACITDWIDGYLARMRNEQTFLGACLDPIADKFFILSVFFTLAFIQSSPLSIPFWFVLLILLKEIILIGGAVLIFATKGYIEVRPRRLGKLTTFIQMIFIGWLFACHFFNWAPIKTYYAALMILIAMVFASLLEYTRIGIRTIK